MTGVRVAHIALLASVFSVGQVSAQADPDAPSLSLLEAVERALEHAPAVRLSAAERKGAHAAVGEARAAWFPTFVLIGSAMQYQEPMIVSPIHGFQPGQTPPFDRTLFQGGATLSYTLFDGGARRARVREARERAVAADAHTEDATQELIANTVVSYLAVLSLQDVLEAHDQRIAALAAERARVLQQRQAGTAAEVEQLRVEAALASAEAERVGRHGELELATRHLARLIGMTPEQTSAEHLVPVRWSEIASPDADSLSARVLAKNPWVTRARGNAAAARAGRAVARGRRWPRFELVGAWLDRGSADGHFTAEWNVGVQLTYPIFTGGSVSRAAARAAAAHRAAEERVRLVELEALHAMDQTRLRAAEAAARAASLRVAVDRFAEVVRIERLRLDTGSGTQTEYLRAEADLLTARAALTEAQHAVVAVWVELARITGDLSLAWLSRLVGSTL